MSSFSCSFFFLVHLMVKYQFTENLHCWNFNALCYWYPFEDFLSSLYSSTLGEVMWQEVGTSFPLFLLHSCRFSTISFCNSRPFISFSTLILQSIFSLSCPLFKSPELQLSIFLIISLILYLCTCPNHIKRTSFIFTLTFSPDAYVSIEYNDAKHIQHPNTGCDQHMEEQ